MKLVPANPNKHSSEGNLTKKVHSYIKPTVLIAIIHTER